MVSCRIYSSDTIFRKRVHIRLSKAPVIGCICTSHVTAERHSVNIAVYAFNISDPRAKTICSDISRLVMCIRRKRQYCAEFFTLCNISRRLFCSLCLCTQCFYLHRRLFLKYFRFIAVIAVSIQIVCFLLVAFSHLDGVFDCCIAVSIYSFCFFIVVFSHFDGVCICCIALFDNILVSRIRDHGRRQICYHHGQ